MVIMYQRPLLNAIIKLFTGPGASPPAIVIIDIAYLFGVKFYPERNSNQQCSIFNRKEQMHEKMAM
jgi:hypothetical protein